MKASKNKTRVVYVVSLLDAGGDGDVVAIFSNQLSALKFIKDEKMNFTEVFTAYDYVLAEFELLE